MNIQIYLVLSVFVIGCVLQNDCPTVSTFFFDERCFWKLTGRWTFQEAHKECQTHEGILAEIPDNETEDMLTKFFGHLYWIGVYDVEHEGMYVDMLNRTQNYTNWRRSQPNNKDKRRFSNENSPNTQRCYIFDTDENIADVDCSMKFSAFCLELQTPFLNEKYTFEEANTTCSENHNKLMDAKQLAHKLSTGNAALAYDFPSRSLTSFDDANMDESMFAWVERGEYNKTRGEEWRNDFNDADCVRKYKSGWMDDWCTSTSPALCSKRIADRCKDSTESTDSKVRGEVCIWTTSRSFTFEEAHGFCLSNNGTFADFSSLNLLSNLTVQNGSKVWIGVHDLHLEGYLMNMKNDSVCLGTEWRGVLLENNEDTDCMSYDTQHGKVRMEPCSISLPPVCFSSPGARCTNGYTSSRTRDYPSLPQTTEESTTVSTYLSTTEESTPISTYLSTTEESTPISTYLSTTVESTPVSTYLSTTEESTPISTYLSTTVESTPVSTYLSTTVESTPISTYLSTTVESTPVLTYLSTTVESTPVSTYLSTTVESTPVSTYIPTTVQSTPISTYLSTTEESTPISTYLSTTVESTPVSTYLSTTVESTPVSTYIPTTVESTPVSTYLSTTMESTPLSTYLSTTEESTPVSTYLSTTEESTPVSTYLSTTVESTPVSTYLSTTVESTPISTYLSTTVESTPISTYLSTTEKLTLVSTYLSTTVESTTASTYLSTTVESTQVSTYLSTSEESTPVSTLSTTVESTMALTTEAGTTTTTKNLKGCIYDDLNFHPSTMVMVSIKSQLLPNASTVRLAWNNSQHSLLPVGTDVIFACLNNHRHRGGNLIRECLPNGTWSGEKPNCTSCMCPCERMKNQVIIKNDEELKTKINKMKKDLAINKAEINRRLRKRISASDPRPTAIAMGMILGPLLLTLFIGAIVISDLTTLVRHLKYCPDKRKKRMKVKKRERRKQRDKSIPLKTPNTEILNMDNKVP